MSYSGYKLWIDKIKYPPVFSVLCLVSPLLLFSPTPTTPHEFCSLRNLASNLFNPDRV